MKIKVRPCLRRCKHVKGSSADSGTKLFLQSQKGWANPWPVAAAYAGGTCPAPKTQVLVVSSDASSPLAANAASQFWTFRSLARAGVLRDVAWSLGKDHRTGSQALLQPHAILNGSRSTDCSLETSRLAPSSPFSLAWQVALQVSTRT